MNPLILIIVLFSLFAASRAILRFKSKELSFSAFLFWLGIWLVLIATALFPQTSSIVAEIVGIGRGVDVAFFTAIVILFYLLFRIYIKLDHIDRDITRLVMTISVREAAQKEKSKS